MKTFHFYWSAYFVESHSAQPSFRLAFSLQLQAPDPITGFALLPLGCRKLKKQVVSLLRKWVPSMLDEVCWEMYTFSCSPGLFLSLQNCFTLIVVSCSSPSCPPSRKSTHHMALVRSPAFGSHLQCSSPHFLCFPQVQLRPFLQFSFYVLSIINFLFRCPPPTPLSSQDRRGKKQSGKCQSSRLP